MSLEVIEGFDHYTTNTDFARKWDSTNGSYGSQTPGRFGGRCMYIDNAPATLSSLPNVQTRIIGFAFQLTWPFSAGTRIFAFRDGTTTQCDIQMFDSTGHLQITRNGTMLANDLTHSVGQNTWYYLEFKLTVGSSGSYELRIGGVPWITGTGNTQATANAYTNAIIFGNIARLWVDDLYLLNTSGSTNNDFLNECKVTTVLPTGDGVSSQWTPSSAGAHYLMVDDNPPNDDTDYNSSNTSGQIDLYTMPAVTITGSIMGIQHTMTARKDDIGARQVQEVVRSGGTNYTGTAQNLGTNYDMYNAIRELDPATGLAWTQTGLNAAQFGIKVL